MVHVVCQDGMSRLMKLCEIQYGKTAEGVESGMVEWLKRGTQGNSG